MTDDYLPISMLNDFVFCPYSIYLHNSYTVLDEELFHDTPQQRGKNAHQSIDNKQYSTAKDDLTSLAVYSERLGLAGKIDLLKVKEKTLIERKRKISIIYDGYKYQLYAQYFCLLEMGFQVEHLFFYSMLDNKKIALPLPTADETTRFEKFIESIKCFDPGNDIPINENKCRACIYNTLCDKTSINM